MRLRRLFVAIGLLALVAAWLPLPVAAAPHWADGAVTILHDKLGWNPPNNLDAPISSLEWNRLVAAMAGTFVGDADVAVAPEQHWVWTYSGGMARSGFIIRREDAIGGLMKLASLLYKEPGVTAEMGALDSFVDKSEIRDDQRVLVAGAVKIGLVSGFPGSRLNPTRPLTYGEGAVLLSRMLTRYEGQLKSRSFDAGTAPGLRGFAAGTDLRLPLEQVIDAGWTVGAAGPAWWNINGAAYALDLPQAGPAPEGKVWVVVDAEIFPWGSAPLTIAPGDLHFTVDDANQVVRIEVDTAAMAALGSPFGQKSVTLESKESVRGFLVFAIPQGSSSIWIRMENNLGGKSGKPGYNSVIRVPLGDLPAWVRK